MKTVYTFVAAGISIGLILALAYWSQSAAPSASAESIDTSTARVGTSAAPGLHADSPRRSDGASGTAAAGTRTGATVTSPTKVVSVREAYREVLKAEERAEQNEVAGGENSSAQPGGESPEAASSALPQQAVGTVFPDEPVVVDQPRLWLPAAMLEPDESIAITTELQVAEWEQLQEEFVQAVGGRAPSNAVEKEAWVRAQNKNDELFRAKFGWDAFQQQQLKAYREGLAPAPPR